MKLLLESENVHAEDEFKKSRIEIKVDRVNEHIEIETKTEGQEYVPIFYIEYEDMRDLMTILSMKMVEIEGQEFKEVRNN